SWRRKSPRAVCRSATILGLSPINSSRGSMRRVWYSRGIHHVMATSRRFLSASSTASQRLFEQHVLARLEGGDADLLVQIIGDDDVHRVDVPAGEQRAVVEIDAGIGPVPASGVRRLSAAARDTRERWP